MVTIKRRPKKKIYGVIPAQPGKPFKEFVEFVSDERRKGDRDDCYVIIAESAKLVGNSAYGRTAMYKSKFRNVKFVNEKQFNRAKNSYFFYDADQHGDSYEVSSNPRTVKQNIVYHRYHEIDVTHINRIHYIEKQKHGSMAKMINM